MLDGFRQTAFVPFDPVSKRTVATVVDAQGGAHRYAKGAPQVIAELARLDPATLAKYQERGQLACSARLPRAGRRQIGRRQGR